MTDDAETKTVDCDLCVVGAGYAALNGLNAAARHLPPGARVAFIDKRTAWGGQWLEQYRFVRLHQPYPMFTAGDQPWRLDEPRSHLATRTEILDHLSSVPRVSASHLDVVPHFRHEYTGHAVHDGRVDVDARPVDADGRPTGGPGLRLRAKRLLKATGFEIPILPPLPLSSSRVRSIGVSDPRLVGPEVLDDDRPVYVVGAGKTAMDCVLHVARESKRRRKIGVITGRGMYFFVRDALYPTGLRRWLGGDLTSQVFLRSADEFDGTNEREVVAANERRGWMTSVFPDAENCRLGSISFGERDDARRNVTNVLRGYLVDVDGLKLSLRDGADTRAVDVEEGAWFVNCTTHLIPRPHEALLSDGGLVCAPQHVLGFSGTSAYFLVHLWYRDALDRVSERLHRVDLGMEPKLRVVMCLSVGLLANLALVTEHLPFEVPARFQGDFDKWYPPYRRWAAIARILGSRKRILEKADRVVPTRFSDPPARA